MRGSPRELHSATNDFFVAKTSVFFHHGSFRVKIWDIYFPVGGFFAGSVGLCVSLSQGQIEDTR